MYPIDATLTMTVAMLSPLVPAILAPVLVHRYKKAYHLLILLVAALNVLLLSFTPIQDQELVMGSALTFLFDNYAWFFVLLANACWFIITIYSYSYTQYHFQDRLPFFYGFMSLSMAVVSANGFAGNMETVLMFYLAGIFTAFPLIRIRHNLESYRAGTLYLVMMLLPTFLILVPTILYYIWQYGDPAFDHSMNPDLIQHPQQAAFILWGLIIGMAANLVWPFDRWLPRCQTTPAPATALLHTVAVVNAGAIVLLKFGRHVLGTEVLHDLSHHFWQTGWLTIALGVNAVVAAWKALKTENLKERFSYSTISQISYILTAILIGTPATMLGGLLHMLSHSIAKICLFFVAGYFNSMYGTVKASQLGPVMPYAKPIAAVVALCGLSIIGFPLLAGYYSKDLMLIAEFKDSHWAAGVFLIIGSLINVLYILPIVRNAFKPKLPGYSFKPVPLGMKAAIALCVALILTFSVYSFYIIRKFDPSMTRELEEVSSSFSIFG